MYLSLLFLHSRSYFLSFTRCRDEKCEHCITLDPPSAAMQQIWEMPGGVFFSPTPSPNVENHFATFLEMLANLKNPEFQFAFPDQHCPSSSSQEPTKNEKTGKYPMMPPRRCSRIPCLCVFTSYTDFSKHDLLFHPKERASDSTNFNSEKESLGYNKGSWILII